MKYNIVVDLIFHEIYHNGVSAKAFRLFAENRISYKKFLEIQKDVKDYKIHREQIKDGKRS